MIICSLLGLLLQSGHLRVGCFVGTFGAALVVNHYKKTAPEFKQRYSKANWSVPYLGVAADNNPTLNAEKVFYEKNLENNRCSGRSYATRFGAGVKQLGAKGLPKKSHVCVQGSCRPHFAVIVAPMSTGELEYVDEWLLFHISIGFDHFYIYYHQDDVLPVQEKLQSYIEKGYVSFYANKSLHQGAALKDALRFANDTFWMARLDMDEFIVPRALDSMQDLLIPLMHGKLQLLMARMDFGDSGHESKPSGLVIQSYSRSKDAPSNFKPLITTSAFDPKVKALATGNPHKFVDESLVPSCEGIVFLLGFLICPKNAAIYWVGFGGHSQQAAS